MAENTKIEWADATVNHWAGCTKVSPACDNCYAERMAGRLWKVQWGAGAARRQFNGWITLCELPFRSSSVATSPPRHLGGALNPSPTGSVILRM